MIVAKLGLSETASPEQVERLSRFLELLRANGQLLQRSWAIYEDESRVFTNLLLPDLDALESSFDNVYVAKARTSLGSMTLEFFGKDSESSPTCSCETNTGFILFTSYSCEEPPVRCDVCFCPIPLYRISSGNHDDHSTLLSWETNYKSCDRLYMNGTVGEEFAMKEMEDPRSSLSMSGLDICQNLSDRFGVPTYYNLQKLSGGALPTELERRCPICSGQWLLPEMKHGTFHFQCDSCRLVANLAESS